MGRTTNGLIKSAEATTAIPAMRFVKRGPAAGTGVPAVDATASILGVSSELDTAVGERCSVIMVGNIAPIVYGGTVAAGDTLTADATGRAVSTTTVGANVGGTAEIGGVVGDIGSVIINPAVR